MKWYVPSWNGDVRVEADPNDPTRSILQIVQPTELELQALELVGKTFSEKGWTKNAVLWSPDQPYRQGRHSVALAAPLSEVAPLLVKALAPGEQVLSAVLLKDGRVETVSGADADVAALAKKTEEEGKAAASVKRPTPSCPSCVPGSVGPAREVLLDFLSPQEHETWARDRYIVVRGGLTGHHYLLAHRHTALARHIGRICWELDDLAVIHFHLTTVPPEEEVLSAKLILEHREPWLRNEATHFAWNAELFKNPFGDSSDGIWDAQFTAAFGKNFLRGMAHG